MRKPLALILVASAVLFQSCLGKSVAVGESSVSTDVESVNASAEFVPGTMDNERIVKVTSNRSWYAHLNDKDNPVPASEQVPWASLDVCEHLNLTNVPDDVEVRILFNRNYNQSAINGVLDFYSEGKIFLSVPVTQSGAVYRLSAVPDKTDANCDADVIKIAVDCNTDWTAEIVDATADVLIDKSSGFDPDSVSVSFSENYELVAKAARIKFSAKDCDDVFVDLTQDKAVPYLKLSPANVYRLPGDAVSGKIIIQTNCAWTASVKSATLSDVVLTKTSAEGGISGDQEIGFTFTNPGVDPRTVLNAVFSIKTDETELNPEFTQRCPLVIDFATNCGDPAFPTAGSAEESTHQITCGESIYSVSLRLFYYKAGYLLFKGYTNPNYGFFTLPAVNGLTLKKVVLDKKAHTSNYKITAKIINPKDESVLSDVVRATSKDREFVTFELGFGGVEPTPGTAYRILSTANVNGIVTKMMLYYE